MTNDNIWTEINACILVDLFLIKGEKNNTLEYYIGTVFDVCT